MSILKNIFQQFVRIVENKLRSSFHIYRKQRAHENLYYTLSFQNQIEGIYLGNWFSA